VREQFMAYAERLDTADIQFVPMAALHGDNVAEKSARMPWYEGAPLLYTLETVYVRNDANHVDPRFPVQTVIRPQDPALPDFRGVAGQVASGVFRPGDEVTHLPSGLIARIMKLHGAAGPVAEAFHPMSVVIELDRDLDVSRGDMLARPQNLPDTRLETDVMLCWLASQPLDPARTYILRQTTRETKCRISATRYKLDVTTLHRTMDGSAVGPNDLARVAVRTTVPLFCDSYKKNRQTGSMLLIDEFTHATVAAGMIL
jgi:sulfate adenylyltransferase subunit 1 (EFTu-like GTPase family)